MSKRFKPGPGFIRVSDWGDNVIWVRPHGRGQGCSVIVYGYEGALLEPEPGRVEVWSVWFPANEWDNFWEIFNKPHRIRHYVAEHGTYRLVAANHKDHPRNNYNRHIYRGGASSWPMWNRWSRRFEYWRRTPVPRAIREAMNA